VTTYAPQTTDTKTPPWAHTGSHLAGALETLKAAINAHWSTRDHASDGFIGDARHLAEGTATDHNPWLNNTVRAGDFDVDGIDAPWLAEQLRLAGAAGDDRLAGGGYVIFNHRITTPDFKAWTAYTGGDPHTSHVHVSVSRSPAGYEDRRPWDFLTAPQPQPPHPAPGPAPTGHDATGTGDGFRAHYGDQGPNVEHLQHELNTHYPAYSDLAEDGVYGDQTAHVIDVYSDRDAHEADTPAADRAALVASDGRDVGPVTARAFHHDGLI
jgi:hypothetical protein